MSSLEQLQATYVTPVLAAETCDQLAEVMINGVEAYVDEVRLMTAERFARSPLSMVDDLRLGAIGQRSAQLGCDGDALQDEVASRLCPATEEHGLAPALILAEVWDKS